MKVLKGSSLIFIVTLIVSSFISTNQAEAAITSWKKVNGKSNCYVRIWNDANTYTKRATTVDWYAERKGSCGGRFDYKANLVPLPGYYNWSGYNLEQSGYFSTRTPIKSFSLRSVDFTQNDDTVINLEIFQNGKSVDVIRSNTFYVHKQ